MKNKKLSLPALRARMGDWIYYISFMKMHEIAERVSFAEEIHQNKSLNDLLQRSIEDRAPNIAKYLKEQEQRFFNTIIVGVYGGAPQWHELSVIKNEKFDPRKADDNLEDAEPGMGILTLSGSEKLYAIDGQHRVAGIRHAVRNEKEIGNDEVSVIFVSAKKDEESIKRTRRLFSTLNRHAKAVSLKDIIALDEDDLIAIITRRLLDEYQLFQGKRINSLVKTKSIPNADKECITTIVTLYEVLSIYFRNEKKDWKDFLKLRPDDATIEQYYKEAITFWDMLQKYFDDLKLVSRNKKPISELRHENGGNLLFRPVGLILIAKCVSHALKNGMQLNIVLQRISKVPLELSEEPWKGLLWETIKKRMITKKENQETAFYLLYYLIGGDITQFRIDKEELKKRYASALNWQGEIERFELPRVISRVV